MILHAVITPEILNYDEKDPAVEFWQHLGVTVLGAILGIVLMTLAMRCILYLTKLYLERRDRVPEDSIRAVVDEHIEQGYNDSSMLRDLLADELAEETLTEEEFKTLHDAYLYTLEKQKYLVQQKYTALQTLQRMDAKRAENFVKLQTMYDSYTMPSQERPDAP